MVLPPVVVVTLGPSRSAGVFIGVLAFGTAVVVLALPLPAVLQAALVTAIAGWAVLAFRGVALRSGTRAVTELRVAGNHLLAVRYGQGPLVAGHVRSNSHVGPMHTTIVWRPDGARWSRALLILPDMLPEDDFRCLRVLLRYARSDEAQGLPASQA